MSLDTNTLARQFLYQALPEEITTSNQLYPQSARDKIWVTLTFAQSLDGKIAGANGQQLILSGLDSMRMTHWMRTMHDAILVGINTVKNDNPQLNVRHLPPREEPYRLPQPVILDTSLRIPADCKLIKNAQQGAGLFPWILYRSTIADAAFNERKKVLEDLKVPVVPVSVDEKGRIPLSEVLRVLQERGKHSLMIEGGQSVITSCLSSSYRQQIDRAIITIAPTFVGRHGVGVTGDDSEERVHLDHVVSTSLGKDLVAAYSVSPNSGI